MAGEAAVIASAIQTLAGLFSSGGGGGDLRADAFKHYMDTVVNQILHPMFTAIQTEQDNTQGLFGNIEGNIVGAINNGLSGLSNLNDVRSRAILEAIYESNRTVSNSTNNLENTLLGQIANVIGSITNLAQRSENKILSTIGGAINGVLENIFGIENSILDDIDNVRFRVDGILDVIRDGINTDITNNIFIPSNILDNLTQNIRGAIESVSDDYVSVLQSAALDSDKLLRLSLDEGIKIAANQAADIRRQTMIDEQANDRQAIKDRYWIPDGEDFNPLNMFEDLTKWIGGLIAEADRKAGDSVARLLGDGFLPDRAELDCQNADNAPGILPRFGGALFNWFISLIAAGAIPLAMGSVRANRNVQNYRMCYPDQLLPEGDLIGAVRRGVMSPAAAKLELRKHGFSIKNADTVIGFAYEYPPLDLLYSMHLRGDISDAEYERGIQSLGFYGDIAKAVKKLEFFIPPPQDLITMAVREVFNEQLARANGQFDDYPKDFGKYAAQQGISDEWAQRYWAAHWRLPSELMGFEMLHRGVIDDKKLDQLLVALDIMPGWREAIKAISYNVLTRVDVRRMHAMGVIDDQQTLKAYKDMGYNESDAELMVRFTKEYNDGESVVDIDVASDLTRSTIMGFYKDKIIDRTVSYGLLIQAGINAVAAELFLQDADLDEERRARKDQIDTVITKFEVGRTTLDQAADEMRGLGLSRDEENLQLLQLEKKAEAKNTLPSKQDLLAFVKAGLLNSDDFITVMEKLGYDRFWSDLYLKTISAGGLDSEN